MSEDALNTVNNLANAVSDSIAGKVAQAVAMTIADPNPVTLLEDLKTAIQLIEEFKAKIGNLHPTLPNILKFLF